MNKLFAWSFEDIADRAPFTGYYFPKAETKDYNVMIDGRNFLNSQ